ncbi:MAG: topoisomerase C-terminal repeat-containing protein, partial [Verrucomicrobiota bacterium]
ETGKTDLLPKFISKKTGRAFKAYLVLKDGKTAFEFEPRAAKTKSAKAKKSDAPFEKIDFTGQTPVGKCPKCRGKIFESATDYICEKSQNESKPCRFKIGKEILGQKIEPEQATKLLASGKTDLLKEFISKAGKTFPAHLVMDEKGKVTFDFPPREGE